MGNLNRVIQLCEERLNLFEIRMYDIFKERENRGKKQLIWDHCSGSGYEAATYYDGDINQQSRQQSDLD